MKTNNKNQHDIKSRLAASFPLFSLLLSFLLLPLHANASAKDRVPLKIGATFVSCPECDDIVAAFEDIPMPETNDEGVPYFTSNWGYDEGTATHFGAFTTIYRVDFFIDGSAMSHFILIAADGSWIEGMNWITPTVDGVSAFVAEFGGDHGEGSGRFGGVTASVEGVIVFNGDDTATYEGNGTIDNLGRAQTE